LAPKASEFGESFSKLASSNPKYLLPLGNRISEYHQELYKTGQSRFHRFLNLSNMFLRNNPLKNRAAQCSQFLKAGLGQFCWFWENLLIQGKIRPYLESCPWCTNMLHK
jgi:hypothetical protein